MKLYTDDVPLFFFSIYVRHYYKSHIDISFDDDSKELDRAS